MWAFKLICHFICDAVHLPCPLGRWGHHGSSHICHMIGVLHLRDPLIESKIAKQYINIR